MRSAPLVEGAGGGLVDHGGRRQHLVGASARRRCAATLRRPGTPDGCWPRRLHLARVDGPPLRDHRERVKGLVGDAGVGADVGQVRTDPLDGIDVLRTERSALGSGLQERRRGRGIGLGQRDVEPLGVRQCRRGDQPHGLGGTLLLGDGPDATTENTTTSPTITPKASGRPGGRGGPRQSATTCAFACNPRRPVPPDPPGIVGHVHRAELRRPTCAHDARDGGDEWPRRPSRLGGDDRERRGASPTSARRTARLVNGERIFAPVRLRPRRDPRRADPAWCCVTPPPAVTSPPRRCAPRPTARRASSGCSSSCAGPSCRVRRSPRRRRCGSIADALGTSAESAVKQHLERLYDKFAIREQRAVATCPAGQRGHPERRRHAQGPPADTDPA